jgi:hypothetical protein
LGTSWQYISTHQVYAEKTWKFTWITHQVRLFTNSTSVPHLREVSRSNLFRISALQVGFSSSSPESADKRP